MPDAEVGVNQVNAQWRLIEKGFELRGSLTQSVFGGLALAHVARHDQQARRLSAGVENRRNHHVPPPGFI